MGKSLKIARKELTGYFTSPVAFLFLGAFLVVNLFIFFWVSKFFSRNIADVRPLFQWMPVLLIFLVGAVTMRMWSEERKTGTVEFLMTLPISSFDLVMGKFLACLSLVGIALALTAPLPLTVNMLGQLDWGPVIGAYIASIFLAGAYTALGLFVSARNDNQVTSLIITVLACAALYFLGTQSLVPFVGNEGAETLQLLGTGSRFESITRGVLDIRDIYYYVSLIGVFLCLNVFALERLRWSKTGTSEAPKMWRNLTLLLVLNFVAANFWLQSVRAVRIDLTESQMYSISQASKNYLSQLSEPMLLRGYFSEKTHPLLAPLVPQLRDLMKEYEVVSNGKIRAEFIDPRENPDLEEEANQKYAIKPVPFQIPGKYEVSLVNSYFDILIQYGDKHEVITFQDLIEVRFSGEADLSVKLRNPEYDITKSIKKVLYDFQTVENLFQTVPGTVSFEGFLSADDKLPEALQDYKKNLTAVLEELNTVADGKLQVEFRDPEEGGGALAKELEERYGFRPMAASLFSTNRFYFYSVLRAKDKAIIIPLSEDLTEEGARRTIESALKRFSPGFLRTVGLVEPPAAPGAGFNPMMGGGQGQKNFRILRDKLEEGYTLNTVKLDEGTVPESIDLLLVAAPKDLSEKAVFALDQFVMKGGTAVILTSPYTVTRTQTEIKHEENSSGLQEWLAHHGISLSDEMIFDPQNEAYPIPIQRNLGGFRVQEIRKVPYPPFVDIRDSGMNRDSLITSGIPQITVNWASPISISEELSDKITITKLLETTDGAWTAEPESIIPDFRQYPDLGFRPGDPATHLIAAAFEGEFASFFSGKESPLLKEDDSTEETPPNPAEPEKEEEPKEIISGIIERSPATARIIVYGSNEFVTDTTLQYSASSGTSQFLNSLQILQNTVDWSLEDRGLLSIRSRGHFTRTLFPLERKAQLVWEYGNYIAALLGLLAVFLIYRFFHTQKLQSHARLIRSISSEAA